MTTPSYEFIMFQILCLALLLLSPACIALVTMMGHQGGPGGRPGGDLAIIYEMTVVVIIC